MSSISFCMRLSRVKGTTYLSAFRAKASCPKASCTEVKRVIISGCRASIRVVFSFWAAVLPYRGSPSKRFACHAFPHSGSWGLSAVSFSKKLNKYPPLKASFPKPCCCISCIKLSAAVLTILRAVLRCFRRVFLRAVKSVNSFSLRCCRGR